MTKMAEEEQPVGKQFKRLKTSVKPINYDIKLEPDLERFTFNGSLAIDVEIEREITEIECNSADLDISEVVYIGGDAKFKATKIEFDADDEKVTFSFAYALSPGPGTLHIKYKGELKDNLKGFYRSKYTNADGEEKYLAVTQFEAVDARRAFPCWDEPALKSRFDITLVVPQHLVALSNMDVKDEQRNGDGLKTITFNKTPIMSTYLVAFVVGEFDYVEAYTANDAVKVRVYTPLEKKDQGRFALDIAVRTLPFYNDYFGIAYPLPKMDLIAIPDFAAGAMENWGLVTYRETALLVDAAESSIQATQYVALVVGHEIAHQWFGNLTTMEWWTHLWLNEGFASWIEYLCVDHCLPKYDIWTKFAVDDYGRALSLDSMKNSHPIEVPVGHPSEIDEIFDVISYSKGASVIRMLHDFIGDKHFRKGLNLYLEKFKYTNASTKDLWNSLDSATTESTSISSMMSSWTNQMGYPVLTVSSEQTSDGKQRILKIAQRKFVADGSECTDDSQWTVPINILTKGQKLSEQTKTVLSDKEMHLFISLPPSKWLKLNGGHVGFFRTSYSSEMLESLMPAIKGKELLPRDRLGIENDVFALAMAGITGTVKYLELLNKGYTEEINHVVWNDIINNLAQLHVIMQYTDVYKQFCQFVIRLLKPAMTKNGWEPSDDHNASMLRSLLISELGELGEEETLAECRRRFNEHCRANGAKIPADIRAAVYGSVMTNGDVETLKQMLKLYRETSHAEEKVRILKCIGSSKDKEVIGKVLEFSMSEEVKSQDLFFVVAGCVQSVVGREMSWTYMQDNWAFLHERYAGGFIINRLIKSICSNFASTEKATEIQKYFTTHDAPSAARCIKQCVERVQLNTEWLRRDETLLKKFLQQTPLC